MELGVIITTLIIVIILQIIILANQGKNSKLIREFIASRAKSHNERERLTERRDNNFKQNRTNQHGAGFKSAPAAQSTPPAANIDNVEKSLRDINLKLKNAERDQEAARRKIHDNIGNNQQRPRPNRDNRGGGGHNKDSRRRDRNSRNNWRNRNEGDEKTLENNSDSALLEHPVNTSTPESLPVSDINPPAASTPATLPDLNPTDFDSDLQHGRKFTVKRRVLQDEASGIGQSENSGSDKLMMDATFQQSTSTPQEPAEQQFSSNDSEIRFGRR